MSLEDHVFVDAGCYLYQDNCHCKLADIVRARFLRQLFGERTNLAFGLRCEFSQCIVAQDQNPIPLPRLNAMP